MGTGSKTKLFLIELIIIILFFSIAGAVCMNIFAQAKMISVQSTELSMASMKAQSAAEVFRGAEGDASRLGEVFHEDEGGFSAYYDGDWDETDEGGAVYAMRIAVSETAGVAAADISVNRNERVIYSIGVKRYVGE
jgi:hypothetical protein